LFSIRGHHHAAAKAVAQDNNYILHAGNKLEMWKLLGRRVYFSIVGGRLVLAVPNMPGEVKLKNVAIRSAPNASDRTRLRLNAGWSQVVRAWFSIQLTSYGGKYSIERMLALDEYTRSTPLWRVLVVIFATPVPMALFVIAQELIPLQDPAEGWKANYGFWIRVLVLEGVVAFTLVIHAASTIEDAALSTRQRVVFCISVSVLSTVAQMGIAACWTFPVPFFTISRSMVVVFVLAVVFRAIVGGRAFRAIGTHKEQLIEYNKFQTVNMLIVITYPAFQVLFEATIDTKWEQPTILLMPGMYFALAAVVL
jgi:hypothetical protein